MNLTTVKYRILYNSKDITRDISDHLLSLSYVDKVEGESDEIELELEDRDGLWQNEWFPEKGDTIEAYIIDQDLVLNCGKFTIDEKKFKSSGDGDVFTISGLAASITKKMRTRKTSGHQNKTLRQLAEYVAEQHSLSIVGSIPNIRFNWVSQNRETDLAFLNRLADMYGLFFSVRDNKLIFQEKKELEGKAHILSLDKTDISDYEFTDKTENTFSGAKVKHHSPENNEVVEYSESDGEGFDVLELRNRAENKQQAEVMAKSALAKKNTRTQTCSVTCQGNVLLVSGVNVELTGFGKFSCIGHVTESKHTLSKSDGYTVSFEAKKVNTVSPAKYKPKRRAIGASVQQEKPFVSNQKFASGVSGLGASALSRR